MAAPPHAADRHGRVGSGLRPPRWTFPLFAARLRMSLGMALALVVSGAVAVGHPAPMAWVPLLVAVGVTLSTLVHEAAHAWAAHSLGYRVEWIVLGGLAGVTAYFGRDDRPLERAAVAMAGPAASAALVLGLLSLRAALPPGAGLALAVTEVAIAVNVLALVANLLPLGGTDGAHLVRGLFEHHRRARPPR